MIIDTGLDGLDILPSDERARLRFWARPVSIQIPLIFLQQKNCEKFAGGKWYEKMVKFRKGELR